MIRRHDDLIDRGADEPRYSIEVVSRVLSCQVATVRRRIKAGVLVSDGEGLCTARAVARSMLRKGVGTVPLSVVVQMCKLAATAPSHAPAVRRGRPPLHPTLRRSHVLRVRLREEEYEQVKRRADGASVSAIARAMLLTALCSPE